MCAILLYGATPCVFHSKRDRCHVALTAMLDQRHVSAFSTELAPVARGSSSSALIESFLCCFLLGSLRSRHFGSLSALRPSSVLRLALAAMDRDAPPPGMSLEVHRLLLAICDAWKKGDQKKKIVTLANEAVAILINCGLAAKQQLPNYSVGSLASFPALGPSDPQVIMSIQKRHARTENRHTESK